jgi:hypothetical protein
VVLGTYSVDTNTNRYGTGDFEGNVGLFFVGDGAAAAMDTVRAVRAARAAKALEGLDAANGADASTSAAALDSGAAAKAADSTTADSGDIHQAQKNAANDPQTGSRAADNTASAPSKPETGNDGSTPSKCSFSPDTPVLLANGTTEAIGALKAGDKVESADPKSGKDVGGRTVEHVWINHDTDLLDVTISDGHGHASVIHTTANHPFWDDTTHTWVRACVDPCRGRSARTG